MKKKIFISAPYLQLEWNEYSKYFDNYEVILPNVEERMEEKDLLKMFSEHPDIEAGIVGDDKFTEKVYENSNLKFLIKWGTGIDSLLTKNNVKIFNTPSAFTIPVSESTIGLILNICRNISLSDDILKQGSWVKKTGFTINESKIGIIGLGNIGSEVAKKLEVFGCEIGFYDPNINNFKYKKYDQLDDLLINSDIVTIHCDLNDTSYHLIGEKELDLLKNKILINTARGPIIDGKLLEDKFEKNNIKLGLDVFEIEPLPKYSILRKSKNAIISAHNTNTSKKFWKNVHMNCVKILNNNL
jgi:D-3-phosphoglycerate dehydrogenase